MTLRTSCAALAAITVFAGQAAAADLGGNCCADLEERVAELEATTAHKGNRKVSLTISGWVNEAILVWDDGRESNAYVGTNDLERSRFRFLGEAKIDADWSAGYLLEIGVRGNRLNRTNQDTDEGGASLDVRQSNWWIKSKQWGKVTLGLAGAATYHITEMDGVNTKLLVNAELGSWIGSNGGGFFLVSNNNDTGQHTSLRWGDILPQQNGSNTNPGNGERFDIIKYESPAWQGFVFSTAWGEDDVWDVALRYTGEVAGFKLTGGIGYERSTDASGINERGCAVASQVTDVKSSDTSCRELGMSGTIQHIESGLYVYGAYGQKWDENRQAVVEATAGGAKGSDDSDQFWYLQAGIERKFVDLGKTTIYGEYHRSDVGAGIIQSTGRVKDFTALAGNFFMAGSEIDVWGLGVVQNIDKAGMDLYLSYRNLSADVFTSSDGLKAGATKTSVEDFNVLYAGALIQF